jgi:hypothetical protein
MAALCSDKESGVNVYDMLLGIGAEDREDSVSLILSLFEHDKYFSSS